MWHDLGDRDPQTLLFAPNMAQVVGGGTVLRTGKTASHTSNGHESNHGDEDDMQQTPFNNVLQGQLDQVQGKSGWVEVIANATECIPTSRIPTQNRGFLT